MRKVTVTFEFGIQPTMEDDGIKYIVERMMNTINDGTISLCISGGEVKLLTFEVDE